MKTRKQWIAMLLMLAMLFTALPIAAFAEGEEENPVELGEMRAIVYAAVNEDGIRALDYMRGDWETLAQANLTPEEIAGLKNFYETLPEKAALEYKNEEGQWVSFTAKWTQHPTIPNVYNIQVPKGKKVRLKINTENLPSTYHLGEFNDYVEHAYTGDQSVGDQSSPGTGGPLAIYAAKYRLIFKAKEGKFSDNTDTYETAINPQNRILYPSIPTREGYLFKDWVVPIRYTKDLYFGGSRAGWISINQPGADDHVAILEHESTNENVGWTYNHFYWANERDTQQQGNPRTLYARWERPTLTFYGKEKDKATQADILNPTYDVYPGKSLEQSKKDQDWTKDGNTDLTDLSNFELPKAPAPAGMEFKGWVYYDANNESHPFDMTTEVNGNLNLYPVFEKSATPDPGTSDPTPSEPSEIVKVVFNANEGAWANGETRREYRSAVGSVITIESAPMREGYKFLYWKGSEFHPGENYTVPAGGHTFVAQWEKDEKKPEEKPSVDSKIKTPRGSALTAEEIAKILAGSKKVVPAIPKAGVGR